MKLSAAQRALLESRYLALVASTDWRLFYTRILYFALTLSIMIFGVLIAALITVEKISWITPGAARAVYWTTFSMSICLSILSGILHLFNIPKKYILCQTTLERLKAEGWAFVSGIGRYHDDENRFNVFCMRIEKIKSKFVAMKVAIDTQAAGAETVDASDTQFVTRRSKLAPNRCIINDDNIISNPGDASNDIIDCIVEGTD